MTDTNRPSKTKLEQAWAFVERVATYFDYTHDDVDELAILKDLQAEANKLWDPDWRPDETTDKPVAWMTPDDPPRVASARSREGMHDPMKKAFCIPLYQRPPEEPRETTRCILHGRVVCEPCAQMAARFHEKTVALAKEISERHTRINKLLYGPGATPGMMLGPMDADAAHRDRGSLLSMLTPEQRGAVEPSRELTLRDFGYAPGNYTFKCLDCGQESVGDKRAGRCETCASQAMRENRSGVKASESLCSTVMPRPCSCAQYCADSQQAVKHPGCKLLPRHPVYDK